MAAITAGTGRKPKPFMLSEAVIGADAVWDSSEGRAAEERQKQRQREARKRPAASSMPAFVPPQLCKSQERPPSSTGWLHEIKFDGYRIQMRVEAGKVQLKTRKGLDWTKRFQPHRRRCRRSSRCYRRWRNLCAGSQRRTGFSALQAALSEGQTEHLVFLLSISCSMATLIYAICRFRGGNHGLRRFSRKQSPGSAYVMPIISIRAAMPCFARHAGCLWRDCIKEGGCALSVRSE